MTDSTSGIESVLESGVLTVTMNRPDKLNAIGVETADLLLRTFIDVRADRDVRAIVLRGAGTSFCAGADITAEGESVGAAAMNALVRTMIALPKPIVASVKGAAAGVGCSLALAADLCVAAEDAFFLLAFTKIGLTLDGGASATVAASIGRQRAMRLALLAERLPAREALDAGLIAFTSPNEDVDAMALRLAHRLAEGPTRAYGVTKQVINRSTLLEFDAALEREESGQALLLATADFREGKAAFAEKRPPLFTGT